MQLFAGGLLAAEVRGQPTCDVPAAVKEKVQVGRRQELIAVRCAEPVASCLQHHLDIITLKRGQPDVRPVCCLAVQLGVVDHGHPQGPGVAPCGSVTKGKAQVWGVRGILTDEGDAGVNAVHDQLTATNDFFLEVCSQL